MLALANCLLIYNNMTDAFDDLNISNYIHHQQRRHWTQFILSTCILLRLWHAMELVYFSYLAVHTLNNSAVCWINVHFFLDFFISEYMVLLFQCCRRPPPHSVAFFLSFFLPLFNFFIRSMFFFLSIFFVVCRSCLC